MPAPRLLAFALFLACAASSAQAQWYVPQAVFATAGWNANADVALAGIGASWDITKRPKARDNAGWAGRIDGQVAHWRGLGTPTDNHYLWDFSAIPTLPPVLRIKL